jgi:2-polyprenyl-6-methoxyphenol hydroxylase-like FAD-dependent oxidoreductase
MLKQSYPVIICGVGPTGLMLAAQLSRFNIDFLIIDKKSGPTKESRAVAVQARSMEIYEQLGLADEIVTNAEKTLGVCFWRKGKMVSEVELKNLGPEITPYDFIIIYEQSKNEQLLYDYLQKNNYEVEWNTELVSYAEKENNFTALLKKENEAFNITAQYLVACDGAKSKLRELTAMEFTGGTYENVFYVADTHVRAGISHDKLNFFVAPDTFNLFFPLKGKERFRAIGILPKQYYHQDEIDFDEVSSQVEKDTNLPLGFYDTGWYSTYRLHHKKVRSFNKGKIFFCGDAAHVHSPAGGQGMNTGLQDAYNLAWKLALTVQEKVKENLLATYHEERNPIAENLLKTTDHLFAIISKDTHMNTFLRMYFIPAFLPTLMKLKAFRRQFFLQVSQTQINYTRSSLSNGQAGKLKAGMRFPYLKLFINNEIISGFHFIRSNVTAPFLLFCYNVETKELPESDLYKAVQIEKNNSNDDTFHKAGFSSSFVCLLRPDTYIGYIADTFNANEFNEYLHSFLKLVSAHPQDV